MSDTLRYAPIMLAAGFGIPLLAALNAQLGARLASPAAAAVVLFGVALGCALAFMLVTRGAGGLARLPGQPAHLFLGGLLVCFYVLAVTIIAPRFGVGNAVFFVLLGQMVSAAVIDHFGLFGAIVRPVTLLRASGLGVMALGLVLIQRG